MGLKFVKKLTDTISTTNSDDYDIRREKDHYEVYRGSIFIGTADDRREAEELIEEDKAQRAVNGLPYTSKKLNDNDHKFYVVEYQDEKGWSPAEGGTIYYAGKRFIRKIGPFNTPEEAAKKLDEFEADANTDATEDEQIKVYRPDIRTLIIYDNNDGTANYYHVERDDRWGSKQTSGGGWDWGPEKNPVKHPSVTYYYFIDKSTGEVLIKEKDIKKFANFVHDYVLEHVTEWRKANPDKTGIDFLDTFEVDQINSINGKTEKFDVMEILHNAYPY